MAPETSTPPSFSRRRKWSIGLHVLVKTIAVFAIVVAANYFTARLLARRFYLSPQTNLQLSPRSLSLVHAITNTVQVTLYYDRDEPLFDTLSALLKEYHLANSKIAVEKVDYYRDAGSAERIKARYHLESSTNRNFII